MRIDLPFCNLKTCRYCFDGNCRDKNRYDGCDYARLKRDEYGMWGPIVNSFGQLTGFLCECGCTQTAAHNYCPDCGKKMDNSTIEQRILQSAQKNQERFYDVDEVVKILNVSRQTVYNMLKDGRLKSVKIGREHRISQSEINRLLKGE